MLTRCEKDDGSVSYYNVKIIGAPWPIPITLHALKEGGSSQQLSRILGQAWCCACACNNRASVNTCTRTSTSTQLCTYYSENCHTSNTPRDGR